MEWSREIDPYYPINDSKNQKRYAQYRELGIKEKKVIFCGRLGEYRYTDMQDTIISALELANKELTDK